MEEAEAEAAADISNVNQTVDTTQAPATVHRKHAAMLERLSNRKQSLSHKSSESFESTSSFLSRFSQSKLSIDSDLARCRQSAALESKSNLKSDLERISMSISDLEKLVAENSYFLPTYELRSCLKTVSDLKQTQEDVTSKVIPKKKFAFKSKKASSGVVNDEIDPQSIESEQPRFPIRESPGFRDKENEVLAKGFKGSEMGEFTISNLNSCEVRLTGCLRSLFIHRLRNCKVYAGPVIGSVLIEEVEECVLVLASHQIRIHNARGSDFYLRVRSRPIIEDCTVVKFAPYCLSYEGIERDLREANLDEETGNWENVDDFRWLRAVQSPNWMVLPESERVGRVTILNLDK
ncbi:hypothetical protein U1Q18_017236 [Sarracenia purpurea var. burkii]